MTVGTRSMTHSLIRFAAKARLGTSTQLMICIYRQYRGAQTLSWRGAVIRYIIPVVAQCVQLT